MKGIREWLMIKVVICHAITNTAIALPSRNILLKLVWPKYSGDRKSDEAPNIEAKSPVIVKNSNIQNKRKSWYLRK
jgi:hypothetical protein